MLHATEPLLLGGDKKLSIHKNGRRTIGMVGVKSKDNHDSKSNISSHIPRNSRSWVMMMINVPASDRSLQKPKDLVPTVHIQGTGGLIQQKNFGVDLQATSTRPIAVVDPH